MSSGSPEPRRSPRAPAAIALRYLCDGCNTAKRNRVDGVQNWRSTALHPQVVHQAELLRLCMDHWLSKQVERDCAYGFACFGRRDLSRARTLGSADSSDEPSTWERRSASRSNASRAQRRATDRTTAAPAPSAASGRRGSCSVFTDAECPAPEGMRRGSQAASLVVEKEVPQLSRCGRNEMYRSTGAALCAG